MTVKNAIKQGVGLITNAEGAFKRLEKRSFESVVGEYLKLLMLSGLAAALTSLIVTLGKAAYYDIVRGVTVNYLNILNFSLSIAAGVFFFYLFAGTFIFAIVSLPLQGLFRHVKYTSQLKILCYALFPLLLFGWVSQRLAIPLLLWGILLLFIGRRASKSWRR